MQIVKKKKDKLYALNVKELKRESMKALTSELAEKILLELKEGPKYSKEISKDLGMQEQKIYYHIRKLEKAGIIEIHSKKEVQGALARYYKLCKDAFFVKFREFEEVSGIKEVSGNQLFAEFIESGTFSGLIVVGSPYSHGPERSRSRDGYYGMDVAMYIGSFLSTPLKKSAVMLDTEIRTEDLKNNIILLGGPVVNKTTEKFNKHMPIRFDLKTRNIFSTLTKKKYREDETGIIVKFRNPFAKGKYVILIAGKRYAGTRAATIALVSKREEIEKGNAKKKKVIAKVVEGIDRDADGIIDDVEFME